MRPSRPPVSRPLASRIPASQPLAPLAAGRRQRLVAGGLYGLIVAGSSLLSAGLTAHMIAILGGLGLAAALAVTVASLVGLAQSSARICEMLCGRRLHPLWLTLVAVLALPLAFGGAFAAGPRGEAVLPAALLFVLCYGVGNGLLTIVRGTLPLVLFDRRTYGAFVGRLLVPSFACAAAAPFVYALVIQAGGYRAALLLSLAVAGAMLAAATALRLLFRQGSPGFAGQGT